MIHHEVTDENERPAAEVVPSNLPKLVCCSGRTVDAVQAMFTQFEKVQNDRPTFNLMAELSAIPPIVHPYRGYAILGTAGPKKDVQVRGYKHYLFHF